MIIDYQLHPNLLPSDRDVMLYSLQLERLGLDMTPSMIRAVSNGELKTYRGKPVQWCPDCADYHTFDKFETNKKRTVGLSRICKVARSRRRRIREYCKVELITDSGLKNNLVEFKKNFSDETKKLMD